MGKPLCLVQAAIATRSGYGEHSRDLVRSLIKMDKFDIFIWGTRWGDTSFINLDTDRDREIFKRMLKAPQLPKQPDLFIHVTVPNEFANVGRFNIGITAGIETTHCSAPWIEGMNRMDLNIVPSKHAKEVFVKTNYTRVDERTQQPTGQLKVEKPIEVLFEGVDTSVYKYEENIPTALRHELKGVEESFCFLYVGHWLQGDLFQDRKDVGGLIKIFLETFKNVPNPPALLLKTALATNSVTDRNEIQRRIGAIKRMVQSDKPLPNVYLLHGELTAEEMNGLYNHPKVKAHISFTKGEGFGRPLLEASVSRKPVIAPNWSGQTDFLNKEFSILLPGQLTQVHPSSVWENVIIPQSSWFTVNYQVASNVMMEVWKNYQKFKQNALKQGMYSEQNFSLNKMHEQFTKIIEEWVPKFPEEVAVSIPALGTMKLPKLKPISSAEVQKPPTEEKGDINTPLNVESVSLPQQKDEHETQITEQPKEETNENTVSTGQGTETAGGN
jgi:glycosyltransferase involved in cell wall biosynthesis